eukprot:scaffold25962_cov69-Phaeocystis_antarctica.AAC.2
MRVEAVESANFVVFSFVYGPGAGRPRGTPTFSTEIFYRERRTTWAAVGRSLDRGRGRDRTAQHRKDAPNTLQPGHIMYSCLLFTHSKHTARELTPVWVSKNLPRETGRAVLGKDARRCQPSEHASGLHRPPAPPCVLAKIDLAILPPRRPQATDSARTAPWLVRLAQAGYPAPSVVHAALLVWLGGASDVGGADELHQGHAAHSGGRVQWRSQALTVPSSLPGVCLMRHRAKRSPPEGARLEH